LGVRAWAKVRVRVRVGVRAWTRVRVRVRVRVAFWARIRVGVRLDDFLILCFFCSLCRKEKTGKMKCSQQGKMMQLPSEVIRLIPSSFMFSCTACFPAALFCCRHISKQPSGGSLQWLAFPEGHR
jgi:hypothetical protein